MLYIAYSELPTGNASQHSKRLLLASWIRSLVLSIVSTKEDRNPTSESLVSGKHVVRPGTGVTRHDAVNPSPQPRPSRTDIRESPELTIMFCVLRVVYPHQ